jgi:hypothetical protein
MNHESHEDRSTAEELMAIELAVLQGATPADLEALRSVVSDLHLYELLIATVRESTKNDESLAQLGERIKRLGTEGTRLAREAAGMIELMSRDG